MTASASSTATESHRASARRLVALIRKESLQIIRDPSSILIAFVLPAVLLFLFGYGVSLDTVQTRVGLVIETQTPLTQDLAASFQASRYFDVAIARDRRAFEEDLVLGRVRGIIIVPATFTTDFAGQKNPTIQVIVDGSDTNTANFVQNYAQATVANWAAMRGAETAARPPPINAEYRFWFNPELKSRNFLVPGSVAIVMTLVGTLLTSLVVAREWERGTMEAIMLGLTSMTQCVIIAILLFGVPFRGSLLALYALSAAFLVPALGQGMLISAATKNQFLASQVALMSGFLPAFLLSGFLFEISSMPTVIQWITLAVPARYLIQSLQTVFLAGDIWPMFLRDIAIMLLIGAIFFLLAARSTRKRIA